MRVTKGVSNANNKASRIRKVRNEIARILTFINRIQRETLIKETARKNYLPLDLRVKNTRALRTKLKKHQRLSKTEKLTKRNASFPKRLFAIKNTPKTLSY